MADDSSQAILETLEDIKAILLIAHGASIEEVKKELRQGGSEQARIYELCEGKTTEEIMALTGKAQEYVNTNVRRLRNKGLVKTALRKGKLVHEQRF